MKTNRLKILLVFSALLMFSFSGELAAQDLLTLTCLNPTVSVEGDTSEVLTATLQDGGLPVEGETIYFWVSEQDLGYVSPTSGATNSYGRTSTTYYAYKTAGTDTVVAYWTDMVGERAELYDTLIITINAGNPYSVNVFPEDTTVVVTEDATIIAKIMDAFGNKVNATDPAQVSFTHSGKGTFGTSSVNADFNIEMAYHTDDSMVQGPPDIITGRLVVSGLQDQSEVYTIGAAPATMDIYADDSTVTVGGFGENLVCSLFDAYGNPSAWADYYEMVDPWKAFYRVKFTVSTGGGTFVADSIIVNPDGVGYNEYYSSNIAGLYTVTGTSGAATDNVDIKQLPWYGDSVVLTPDTIAIPAGYYTTITAELFDIYGNHINMTSTGWLDFYTDEGLHDEGYLSDKTLNDDSTISINYHSDPYEADTAHVWVYYPDLRYQYYDTTVVFSAEPGELHHFAIGLLSIYGFDFDDVALVSDGSSPDTLNVNAVTIAAQDVNNIHLYTYDNLDTLTLTLDESTAGASQVIWFIPDTIPIFSGSIDTISGLTAIIPEGGFTEGLAIAGLTNQVAETVTITATDGSDHTGTSPALTWLPISVVGFDVAIEGGLTTIKAIDDTVNMEVTAIDMFGNTTGVGLPLNVILSATRPVNFLSGETQLMEDPVSLYPMVATQPASDLVLRAADISHPAINGSSDPIVVDPSGIEEGPVVSGISASFGSGDITYAVATDGEVSIKVYNKVGMEVGSLVNGAVKRGYYQASLEGLNLSSDIYFVVMQGPGINKKIKATLIK